MRGCITASIRRMCLRSSNGLTQLSQQDDLRISEMFGVENDYFEILGRVQKMENCPPVPDRGGAQDECRNGRSSGSNTTKNVIREGEAVHSGQF